MMSKYIGLENFKAIYVVDLCHSLCEVSKRKAKSKGWKNVHIIEGDACRFTPPEGQATLVTFSYSLSSKLLSALHACHSPLSCWAGTPPHNHPCMPHHPSLHPDSDSTFPQCRGQRHQHPRPGRLPRSD